MRCISALLLLATACATPTREPAAVEIVVLTSLAEGHLAGTLAYALTDLRAQLKALAPDVVCGEIAKAHLGTPTEGLSPAEAIYLAEIAATDGFRFVAADEGDDLEAEIGAPSSTRGRLQRRHEQAVANLTKRIESSPHATAFDLLHTRGQDFAPRLEGIEAHPDPAENAPGPRHHRIVERCLGAADGAQRIAFVFGPLDAPLIRSLVAHRPGYVMRPVQRRFEPASQPVPAAVVERWHKDRQALMSLIQDGRAPPALIAKLIASRRLTHLAMFIQSKGRAGYWDHSPGPTELRRRLPKAEDAPPPELAHVTALRDWVHTRWSHDSWNEPPVYNSVRILEAAEGGERYRCVEYAFVLADVYLARGFEARIVRFEGNGAHVATEVYLPRLAKWALMDAQFASHVVRTDGVPLSGLELQDALRNDRPVAVRFGHAHETRPYLAFMKDYLRYLMVTKERAFGQHLKKLWVLVPPDDPGPSRMPPYLLQNRAVYVRTTDPRDLYRAPTAPNPDS